MIDSRPSELETASRLEALRTARSIADRPERGWLRAVRTTLGLTQAHVAGRASMTRQAYADLEAAEERGAISLNSLRRAADAMDADFAYFIVPRTEIPTTPTSGSGARADDDDELPVELR